jgi:hypothetical protein
VLGVHNPLKEMTVEYVVSMLEPGASPQATPEPLGCKVSLYLKPKP